MGCGFACQSTGRGARKDSALTIAVRGARIAMRRGKVPVAAAHRLMDRHLYTYR